MHVQTFNLRVRTYVTTHMMKKDALCAAHTYVCMYIFRVIHLAYHSTLNM